MPMQRRSPERSVLVEFTMERKLNPARCAHRPQTGQSSIETTSHGGRRKRSDGMNSYPARLPICPQENSPASSRGRDISDKKRGRCFTGN